MRLELSLRLAMRCLLCEQLSSSEQLPPTCRPVNPLTGRINWRFVIEMGFCPSCYCLLDEPMEDLDGFLDRCARRFSGRREKFAIVAAKLAALGYRR